MSDWRWLTLQNLCAEGGGGIQTGPFGSQLHASDYVSDGIPSVMPQNIGDNVIDPIGIARVAKEDADRLAKYRLRDGDIIYSRRGDVERRALVRPENDGWLCGTGCLRVRLGDQTPNDARFLSYLLGTEESRTWIVRHAVGATMLNLNTSILGSVPLRVPAPDDQRAIAEVLGALDDKIAANTILVSLLSRHVDTLFESIVGSESERIKFSELVSTTRGVSYRRSELQPSKTALVTLKSVGRGGSYSPRGLKPFTGTFKALQEIIPGEVVVAQTDLTQAGDVIGHAVRVPESRQYEKLVASLDIAIVRPYVDVPTEVILGIMHEERFREHCKSRTSGTTVLHLTGDAIQTYSAPKVPIDIQQRYASAVRPMFQRRDVADGESDLLAEIRDALLPQLMSGKLRVRDAEKTAEEVL